jgi:glucose dehydrogenase
VAVGVVAGSAVALSSGSSSVAIPAFNPAAQAKLPANDWFVSAGNLAAQRHSALTQITPANVSGLKPAFSFVLDGSGYEPRPLIGQESLSVEYSGVLYSMDSYGRVYATDATNGHRLWLFEPNNANYVQAKGYSLPGSFQNIAASPRGVTVGDGMVFVPEPQGEVVALDAATGTEIWSHQVLNPLFQGTLAEPPVYYDGKVIMATSGGDGGFSCIVFALDAKTGKPLWHFNLIPSKGQPGFETWSQPLFWPGGAASWTSVAINEKLDNVYISTGNTIPYTGYERGPGKEYYTAGTLALHAKTGKMAWFYQEVHHDNWDADTTLGPMLYSGMVNGAQHDAVVAVNRTGLLFMLDAKSGKPIFPAPETPVPTYGPAHYYPTQPIPQTEPIFPKVLNDPGFNAFTGLQGPDGKPFIYHNTVAANAFPAAQPDGWYIKVGSNINGASPSSVDPTLGYAFFEGTNSVTATEELPPSEIPPTSPLFGGPVNGGVHSKSAPAAQLLAIPQVAAINGSDLVAMDLSTGKRVWINSHLTAQVPDGGTLATFNGGMLTTASGLLFTGNGAAESAYDSKTGALLWTSAALPAIPWGPPSTYMVNGKQYIAFQSGDGGLTAPPPGQKTTVYVYSLP